ncbi:MAG TPA: hypothetical protein VL689_03635 [Paraburkholderia sp.]|nr:hypothetical protein [Paraburkholderia sp.]
MAKEPHFAQSVSDGMCWWREPGWAWIYGRFSMLRTTPSEPLSRISAKADVKKKASQGSKKKLEFCSSLLAEINGELE